MKRYIERLKDIIGRYPDRAAIDDTRRRLTYGGLETESGKVYGYLKKRGIGREDRVLIITERGAETVSCIIGVLKAGAAFVPLEAGYPQERVDYIKKDTGCVLAIDQTLYEKIMTEEAYLPGHEDTDPHDAAYIIYTSGSTGNPKGILHEYGNIDQQASIFPDREDWPEHRRGLIAPFYFVAAWQALINYTLQVFTTYLIPQDIVHDLKKLTGYLYDNRIQGIYLPPSYIRLYQDPSPYLEVVMTGSEPANGLYYPGGRPGIRNVYGLSEAGVTVLEGVLDKAWDVAPVGRPVLDELDVHLIDDDGNRIEGPGTGELCFKSEYVRGYVNLPEKTKEAFVNGIYHTGDICRRDESGVYFVCGRKDDMFKINGNRIEPAEIERRVKEITGLEHVHAKGFREEGRAYIVVYYLIGQAEEKGIYKDGRLTADLSSLADCLPSYMIPSYYAGLAEFPLNANGKLDRQALTPPAKDAFQGDYTAPENEQEAFFCGCMQEVLGLERVGAEDDFYAIGGDSISVMRFIARCAEGRHEISIGQLYECRTPRRLAAADTQDNAETDAQNVEALHTPQPLTDLHKIYIRHYLEEPSSTYYNLPELFVLKEDVDIQRLRAAADKVFRAHPALLTRFVKTGEEYRQVYDEGIFEPTGIRELSDAEFEAETAALVRPMELTGGRLYRSQIYVTPSKKYLFTDVHHSVADGRTARLLRDQIYACYNDPGYAIPADYYYYYTAKQAQYESTASFREALEYYDSRYGREGIGRCSRILKPDREGPDIGNGIYTRAGLERKEADGRGLRYLAAMVLAIAEMNGEDSALIHCVYDGRNEPKKNDAAGLFACAVPVYYRKKEGEKPGDILRDIREQIDFGMAHCDFHYAERHPAREANTVLYNYLKNIADIGAFRHLIAEKVKLPRAADQKNGPVICGMIDIEGVPALTYYMGYSKGYYSEEFCRKLFACFEEKSRLFD